MDAKAAELLLPYIVGDDNLRPVDDLESQYEDIYTDQVMKGLDPVEFIMNPADLATYNQSVTSGRVVLSVKDYGAKGDGVTDDTAAIQAAVNAGVGKPKCECGSAAVGSNFHSSWCPCSKSP